MKRPRSQRLSDLYWLAHTIANIHLQNYKALESFLRSAQEDETTNPHPIDLERVLHRMEYWNQAHKHSLLREEKIKALIG